MQCPQFDIEKLAGLKYRRPKRWYEQWGSVVFGKTHLTKDPLAAFFSAAGLKLPSLNQLHEMQHTLLDALCSREGNTLEIFPTGIPFAYEILGKSTGWFVFEPVERRYGWFWSKVGKIVTVGDYHVYLAIRDVARARGLCHDLTRMLLKLCNVPSFFLGL